MTAYGQITALVRAQLLSILNTLRKNPAGGRGAFSLAFGILWYLAWFATAAGCAVLPSLVGRSAVETVVPGILLFILIYWQLAPILTLSLGVSLDMRRLMIYPVSTSTLFAVECLLRLGTGIEMAAVLCGLWLGLAYAGTPHWAGMGLAFALFILFNVFLSAGVRNLLERLFQGRRARELMLLAAVSALVLPQFLYWHAAAQSFGRTLFAAGTQAPYWLLPSGLASRIALGEAAAADGLILLGMTLAAGLFGYTQFQTCRRCGAAAAVPRPNKPRLSLIQQAARVSGGLLPDPMAAIVDKEIKYLWRSPRFRLPFFMGFTFGVLAWVPLMKHWEEAFGSWMMESAVSLVSLYAFLLLGPVMFLNRFGFDRSAARFYYWMPLDLSCLLMAKNIATVVFAAAEVALIAAVCWLIGLPAGWTQVGEAAVVCSVALLYLLTVGNYVSVHLPASSDPDRVSKAGAGHGLSAVVQFLIFPAALTPVGLAYVARWLFGSLDLFVSLLILAAGAGACLYLLTLSRLAHYAEHNRESIVARLSYSEGPIVAE